MRNIYACSTAHEIKMREWFSEQMRVLIKYYDDLIKIFAAN